MSNIQFVDSVRDAALLNVKSGDDGDRIIELCKSHGWPIHGVISFFFKTAPYPKTLSMFWMN